MKICKKHQTFKAIGLENFDEDVQRCLKAIQIVSQQASNVLTQRLA